MLVAAAPLLLYPMLSWLEKLLVSAVFLAKKFYLSTTNRKSELRSAGYALVFCISVHKRHKIANVYWARGMPFFYKFSRVLGKSVHESLNWLCKAVFPIWHL